MSPDNINTDATPDTPAINPAPTGIATCPTRFAITRIESAEARLRGSTMETTQVIVMGCRPRGGLRFSFGNTITLVTSARACIETSGPWVLESLLTEPLI